MIDPDFAEIRKKSQKFFKHSHHDWSHVERVYRLAAQIAEKEEADLDVVKAAALLHDVARAMEDEGKIDDHAAESAKIAKAILQEARFPKDKIMKVAHCIETHRFRKGLKPKSLEARILQDADRLDMLGAVGIARVFSRGGWGNKPIHDPNVPPKKKYDGRSETCVNHIYEKILRINGTINTKTAKEIAQERHKFVEQFLERLLKEWNSEI